MTPKRPSANNLKRARPSLNVSAYKKDLIKEIDGLLINKDIDELHEIIRNLGGRPRSSI